MTTVRRMEELISKLPPGALVVFAISLAVLFFTQRMGFWQGVKAPPDKSEAAAPVAAVIVDSSSLDRATASIEALNMTLIEQNMVSKKFIDIERELKEEIDKLREEIRVSREVGRR